MYGNQNQQGDTESGFMIIQAIHLALGTGVFLFMIIVAYLSVNAVPIAEPDMFLHEILGYLSVFFGFFSAAMAYILFPVIIGKSKSFYSDITENRYHIFRQAHITRMAMIEGSALFGLVALLLFIMNVGPLRYTSVVILPVIPVGIFFVLWFLWFPSEEKVRDALNIN